MLHKDVKMKVSVYTFIKFKVLSHYSQKYVYALVYYT